jgi:hypothetical protein
MKVVSDKFVQRAKRAIVSVERPCPSRTTATGLPRRGTEEKTSFWTKLRLRGVEDDMLDQGREGGVAGVDEEEQGE